jgi:hypothetical protein
MLFAEIIAQELLPSSYLNVLNDMGPKMYGFHVNHLVE